MNHTKQGRIHLDLDEVVKLNHTTITFGSFNPISSHALPKTPRACFGVALCESPKPKQTQAWF